MPELHQLRIRMQRHDPRGYLGNWFGGASDSKETHLHLSNHGLDQEDSALEDHIDPF